MQTFLFLFDSFGFLSWIFVLGCILAGVAFAHTIWAFKQTQILQLRREQSRLRQELALQKKSMSHKSAVAPQLPKVASEAASAKTPLPVAPDTTASPLIERACGARSTRPLPCASAAPSSPASRVARKNSLREDRQLGLVFYLAPDEPDPLDRLPSITPAQVRDLHMLGIYKFEQIARWNETNLQSFAVLLGIDPENLAARDWVREAKVLHGETHGSKMVLAS